MSLIRFELNQDHVNLLKHLKFGLVDRHVSTAVVDDIGFIGSPFGGDNIYDDMGQITIGKPEGEFDPTNEDRRSWSDEQIEYMDTIMTELPMALELILYVQSFELGNYKRKFHDIVWEKY